jgi:hypothetical protein
MANIAQCVGAQLVVMFIEDLEESGHVSPFLVVRKRDIHVDRSNRMDSAVPVSVARSS